MTFLIFNCTVAEYYINLSNDEIFGYYEVGYGRAWSNISYIIARSALLNLITPDRNWSPYNTQRINPCKCTEMIEIYQWYEITRGNSLWNFILK